MRAKTIKGSISPSSARTAEWIARDELDERLCERLGGGCVGLERLDRSVFRGRVAKWKAVAGPHRVDEQHPDEHRERAHHDREHQRPDRNALEMPAPSELVDANHERREHHRDDDHEYGSKEELPDGAEQVDGDPLDAAGALIPVEESAGGDAENQRREEPRVQLHAAILIQAVRDPP
jgi:hypothetical protein